MSAPSQSSLIVPCPFCKAPAGEWCYRIEWFVRQNGRAKLLHPSRVRLAREQRAKMAAVKAVPNLAGGL